MAATDPAPGQPPAGAGAGGAGAPPGRGREARGTVPLVLALPVLLAAGWLMAGAVVRDVPPLAAAFGRTAAAVPVLALVAATVPGYRAPARGAFRRPGVIVALATTGFLAYYIGTFVSINLAGPSLTGLVVSLLPCMTFVLGVAAFGEQPHARRGAGTLVATAAVVTYTLTRGTGTDVALPVVAGAAVALVATTSYALYTHLFGRTMRGLPSPASLPAITLAGALLLAPAGLWQARAAGVGGADWLLVALLGAGLTAPVFLVAHELVLRRGPLLTNSVALVVPFLIRLGAFGLGWEPAPGAVEIALFAVCAAGVRLVIVTPPSRRSQ